MGRELRAVPADWKHPQDAHGAYIPMYEQPYQDAIEEWIMGRNAWAAGTHEDYDPQWTWEVWAGRAPDPEAHMPQFPEGSRTHWMMYENTSEGTPISPAFATVEELARWLADTNASAFASMTATYEQWLATCKAKWAPCMVIDAEGLKSGVQFTGERDDG